MNVEKLFGISPAAFPIELVVVLAACLLVMIGLTAQRRRLAKEAEPPPKPRPTSIETELQIDVKRRWKNRFQKQPFSGRS